MNGQRWSLAKLRGVVGVLNFWATWCEACLAEMPQLNSLARRHQRDGQLVVLGINYQEGEAAIGRFGASASLAFPLLRDPDGAAFRAWAGLVLPSSVLLSRNGLPRFAVYGELDWESSRARSLLDQLLAEKAVA